MKDEKTILRLKKGKQTIFAIAEPFYLKDKICHVDAENKIELSSDEVSYMLVRLKDGKRTEYLGYIPNLNNTLQLMRVYSSTVSLSPPTFAYTSENIIIMGKVHI